MRSSYWSSDVCSSDLTTTTTWQVSRPMSWPSSPPTTSPSTSRRSDGERPTRSSARRGPKTRQSSRSTRTISLRDHTPPRSHRLGYAAMLGRVLARAPHRDSQPEPAPILRSEEHTSELQSLMRISYAVFCLKKKIQHYR